jgi:erythronate-4-phosphate dehydrogenase
VNEPALLNALRTQPELRAIIDVWANEPDINTALLREAHIATPHIAGYSTDGRLRATAAIAAALCKWSGVTQHEIKSPQLPGSGVPEIPVAPGADLMSALQAAVLGSYDVRSDAIVLRRLAQGDSATLAQGFAEARNTYPLRREFSAHRVVIPSGSPAIGAALTTLGFNVSERP